MANIKKSKKIATDSNQVSNYLRCHALLTALRFPLETTCSLSRIEKNGTGDNNFGKWKRTFRSHRPKWPDRSQWTTFKAGPEYSGRTKPKWSVPFDEPTEISGLLGWMESAHSIQWPLNRLYFIILHLLPFKRFWFHWSKRGMALMLVRLKCSLTMVLFPPLWVTATHLFGLLLV